MELEVKDDMEFREAQHQEVCDRLNGELEDYLNGIDKLEPEYLRALVINIDDEARESESNDYPSYESNFLLKDGLFGKLISMLEQTIMHRLDRLVTTLFDNDVGTEPGFFFRYEVEALRAEYLDIEEFREVYFDYSDPIGPDEKMTRELLDRSYKRLKRLCDKYGIRREGF